MKYSFVFLFAFLSITNQLQSQDIYINKDTTIDKTWNLPAGTILHFGSKGHISGSGTIKGGIIDAALMQWIFDTTLTVIPEAAYNKVFSAKWFGAGMFKDNYVPLQKSINLITENATRLRDLFIPLGEYAFSKPLLVQSKYKGKYSPTTIHLFGESNIFDCCRGTTLLYTGTDQFALGLQMNKGSEINNLNITGQFKAPASGSSGYYQLPMDKFGDQDGKCSYLYAGLVIDYDGSNAPGGSTGVKVHDLTVGNFSIDYLISPNGVTFNADILIFENIRCGDARVGFANGQAQEKGNVIRGIYSWGNLHTLYSAGRFGKGQAGSYTIDGGNIAGGCIRLFDISQAGWYSTNVSNLYAESIGTIGSISTQIPLSISNSTFHFAPPKLLGKAALLSVNSNKVTFNNCIFRYYGYNDAMRLTGEAVYNNCFFSGELLKK